MNLDAMMIGTLFDQEEVASKKNFYNIAARDEKGKKFFHGSFTGGFSAGYKNTCGSKEGWVPSTFISSRDQRFKGSKQNIQDFMDEDDLGSTIAGETITARAEYDTLGDRQREYMQKQLGTSILGAAPEEFIISNKSSIGYEILGNMGGFKKTMTVPPKKDHKKVYGVHMPSTRFKPTESMTIENEDLQEFSTEIPKPNEQFSGLNFSRASFEEDEYEAIFNKIFKKHAQLEPIEEENKTKASNRVSMKAYGFDDDDDPYTGGQMSKFIMEENENPEENLLKNAKMKKTNKNILLEFEKDPIPYRVDAKKYEPEDIPKDWDPFKKVKEYLNKDQAGYNINQSQRYQELNPQKRAAMLGEDKDILEEKLAVISEETKKRIIGVKKFVRGENQTMGADDLNLIFQGDKDKIERYKFFCWEKLGKLVSGIPPGNMSYEAMKKEKEEFEKIYQMQNQERVNQEEEAKPEVVLTEEEKKQAELLKKIDELKKNIQREKERRRVEYWLPDRILCRRFNVPQPNVHRDYQETSERQYDKFSEEILPAFLGNKGREVIKEPQPVRFAQTDDMPVKEFKSNKMEREQAFQQRVEEEREIEEEEEPEEVNIDIVEERPPMELFESIFGDEGETS